MPKTRASIQHRIIDRALRVIRFRHAYWKQFDGVKTPKRTNPTKGMVARHKIGRKDFDGFPFLWFDPSKRDPEGYVVALHGGGYVAEASGRHFSAYAKLADLTGKRIYAPFYPLAPFHTPEEIRDWTLRFVAHVQEHNADYPLLMTGDSAGANLALQLIESGTVPLRLVLWSPWVDVEGANPLIMERDGSCALIRAEGLQEFAKTYYGDNDPRDPMLSPLFRESEALPPTLVLSGDQDLFHPDIEAYAGKRDNVTLETAPGLWHDYMIVPTPEARAALTRSADFLSAT